MAIGNRMNNDGSGGAEDILTGAAQGASFGPYGAAAGVVGGLLGNVFSNGANNEANRIQQDIYNRYANLEIPDIEKQKLALALQHSAGTLTPQGEVAQQLGGHDALQDVNTDPRL